MCHSPERTGYGTISMYIYEKWCSRCRHGTVWWYYSGHLSWKNGYWSWSDGRDHRKNRTQFMCWRRIRNWCVLSCPIGCWETESEKNYLWSGSGIFCFWERRRQQLPAVLSWISFFKGKTGIFLELNRKMQFPYDSVSLVWIFSELWSAESEGNIPSENKKGLQHYRS